MVATVVEYVALAAGTVAAHGVIAWQLWRRGHALGLALVATAEERSRKAAREEIGAAFATMDLTKLPVEGLLQRVVASDIGRGLIEQAVNHGTGQFIAEVLNRLGMSEMANTSADRSSERAALGKMLLTLVEKTGLMPIIEAVGMKESLVKNPRGALTLIRQLAPGFLEQALTNAYNAWQQAQQAGGPLMGGLNAVMNSQANVDNRGES